MNKFIFILCAFFISLACFSQDSDSEGEKGSYLGGQSLELPVINLADYRVGSDEEEDEECLSYFDEKNANSAADENHKPTNTTIMRMAKEKMDGAYEVGVTFKRFVPQGLKNGDRLFDDDEIIEVLINIPFDPNSKTIIPGKLYSQDILINDRKYTFFNQGALQACSHTCVAIAAASKKEDKLNGLSLTARLTNNHIMNGKERRSFLLQHDIGIKHVIRRGRVSEDTVRSLHDFKFTIIESDKLLEHLMENHNKYDFAIVTIDDKKIKSHSVLVIMTTKESVTLFDPLHGWLIKVTPDAFKKRTVKKVAQDLIWIENL